MTGFGLLALRARSCLMAGLARPARVCSNRGEVAAGLFTEVLMYFCDEAVRAAGSAAVGNVFLGDLGEVAVCCGLSARCSILYLPLTGLKGGAWLD